MLKRTISVVVPVYNEAGALPELHQELLDVLNDIAEEFEIIYVNDGSTDNTFQVLKGLDKAVIVDFNRNYGQATSLNAGFQQAKHEYIISLDGDGQNDPADIPRLLEKLEKNNLDVVAGWRKNREDKGGIKVLTRIGRVLRRVVISDSVHDTGCTLRVYKSHVAKSLDIGGEMHRYILALLRWKGFKMDEIVVNDRRRVHGVSKYGYTKAVRGLIDLIYVWFVHKYSQRPLHLFGYMSLGWGFLGALALGWSIYGKLATGLSINRNGWFFVAFFFILGAIMLFSFGIVIDLLVKIYHNTSSREKRYYVREVIGGKK